MVRNILALCCHASEPVHLYINVHSPLGIRNADCHQTAKDWLILHYRMEDNSYCDFLRHNQ